MGRPYSRLFLHRIIISHNTPQSKHFLQRHIDIKDGILLHSLASTVASFNVAVFSGPFDSVSVRLYNQPAPTEGAEPYYRGVLDCFRKTFQREGARGFYKGFWSIWLRNCPHVVATFIIWEQLLALEAKYLLTKKQ